MQRPFSLVTFLEDHDGFKNQYGVGLLLLNDETIHVACAYPGVPDQVGQSLEVVGLFPDEEACMTALKAGSKIQLNQVTPFSLLQAYEEGRMRLSCLVERSRLAGALQFKKRGDVITATDEDRCLAHKVIWDLRFGHDYIAYTKYYFHLV